MLSKPIQNLSKCITMDANNQSLKRGIFLGSQRLNPGHLKHFSCESHLRGLLKIQFPLIISLLGKQACQANGME